MSQNTSQYTADIPLTETGSRYARPGSSRVQPTFITIDLTEGPLPEGRPDADADPSQGPPHTSEGSAALSTVTADPWRRAGGDAEDLESGLDRSSSGIPPSTQGWSTNDSTAPLRRDRRRDRRSEEAATGPAESSVTSGWVASRSCPSNKTLGKVAAAGGGCAMLGLTAVAVAGAFTHPSGSPDDNMVRGGG
ncbi:hypothetical protein IAU59_001777 [Kwoniella sp. CBS 9459]